MKIEDTYFSLLNINPCFAIDEQQLEASWRDAASQVHPDRFATASTAEKRVAMQWASRINQAYQTLKMPVTRAAYLCELAGQSIDADNNTKMDSAFLMKQMQWREELDDARKQPQLLAALQGKISQEEVCLEKMLSELLDHKQDFLRASEKVRELMFIAKIQNEIKLLIA